MEVPNITWDDIGGLEDVKRELQELVQVNDDMSFLLLLFSRHFCPKQRSSEAHNTCQGAN